MVELVEQSRDTRGTNNCCRFRSISTRKSRAARAHPQAVGSFSIDDGNCNDNATN